MATNSYDPAIRQRGYNNPLPNNYGSAWLRAWLNRQRQAQAARSNPNRRVGTGGTPLPAGNALASSGMGASTTNFTPQDFLLQAANAINGGPANGTDTTYTTQPIGSGGSTAGGSSGGTGGGAGSNPLEKPRTGSASQYIPGADPLLYDDPRIIVRDTLKKMGYDTDSGIMDLIGQDADMMPYLAMLALGSGAGSENSQDNNSVFNYMNQWAQNQATPGGATMDPQAAMSAILNAPGGSALKAALTGGTPQQQAQAINQMLSAASMNMSPLMQQALARHMQDQTDDALSAQAHGNKGTILDWLNSNGGFYGG